MTGTAGLFSSEGGWLINPGNSQTFPWLASIAARFQEYRFNGLMFEYRTTSSDALNSTNTALGVVIGATEYNVTRADWQNKAEMDNYEFVVSGKPSSNLMFPVECKPGMNVLGKQYVDSSLVVPTQTGQDPRMSWLGKFQLATSGFQASNVVIGELWVTYDVTLYKPAAPHAEATSDLFGHFANGNNADYPLTGVTAALPFGTQTACSYVDFGTSVTSALYGSQGQREDSGWSVNWADYFHNSIVNFNAAVNSTSCALRDQRFRSGAAFTVLWYYKWSASVTTPTMSIAASTNCADYNDLNHLDTGANQAGVNWVGGAGTVGIAFRMMQATNTSIPLFTCTPGADPSTNLIGVELIVRAVPRSGLTSTPPIAYMMGEDLKHGWLRKEISLKPPTRKLKKLSMLDAGDSKEEKKEDFSGFDAEPGDWEFSESEAESEADSDADLSPAQIKALKARLEKEERKKTVRTMNLGTGSQSRPNTPVTSQSTAGLGLGPGPQISSVKPSTSGSSSSSKGSCKFM